MDLFDRSFKLYKVFFCEFRDIPEDVLNTYCWIHSTYTVEGGGIPGKDSAYPGVRPAGPNSIRRPARYYQWVAFVLFIQVRF